MPSAWLSDWRADLQVALFVLGLTVALGGPAGLLWSAIAPHADVVIGEGRVLFADGVTEDFIAADAFFGGVCVALGIVIGALAWRFARAAGPFVVVALALGGVVAAFLAAEVGMLTGQQELQAAVDASRAGTYQANVALKADLALLLWPTAALATFLTLLMSRPDQRG